MVQKETKKPAAKKPTAKKAATKKEVAVKEKETVKEVKTGEDLFIVINGKKHEFKSQISPIYDVKEYYYKGKFSKGDIIKFVRASGEQVPVHNTPNCGYTLVGKAQRYILASKALVANGETGDDQEYVYINDHSVLTYIGENETHTLFVRVYDNLTGTNNDRWVVIYID